MEKYRKHILRIHGSVLILAGAVNSVILTMGLLHRKGIYFFIAENKLAYIGLIQAYALAFLMGIVLWLGSYQKKKRKWNAIGLLFHTLLLVGYLFMASFFITIPNGSDMLRAGLTLHITFFLLEAGAVFINKNP